MYAIYLLIYFHFLDKESLWKGPFFFIQGSDTQFGMIDSYIKKNTIITWDEEIIRTKKCIQAINAMNPKPRFFIVCGDLIDAMPGNTEKIFSNFGY